MQTSAERTARPDGFVETGTIAHEGRTYQASAAIVSDQYLACYPAGETIGAAVNDWNGSKIGAIVGVSSRPAIFFGHRSWQGSDYYYMRVRLTDGRTYAVQGFGAGMLARGKRIKG